MAYAALAVIVPAFLASVPASAQENRGAASSGASRGGSDGGGRAAGGGGTAVERGGGGGGGAASGGSTSTPSGGGGSWSGSGGARTQDGGGATGGSGVAYGDRGSRASGGGARAHGATGTPRSDGGAVQRGSSTGAAGSSPRTHDTSGANAPNTGDGTPQYARPRDGHPGVGTAVPRGSAPTTDRGGAGSFGPAGYYGGYFPWVFGDPYGYYGGYYDPWYGAYPMYTQAPYGSSDDTGSVHLKIKPREAEVYVDGYYVGIVDQFDGIFQRLHVETGPHRIEVRAPGYEPLTIDLRVTADHTVTYEGELKKIQ